MGRYTYVVVIIAALCVPALSFGMWSNGEVDEALDHFDQIETLTRNNRNRLSDIRSHQEQIELHLATTNLLLSVGLGCWVTLSLYKVARHG